MNLSSFFATLSSSFFLFYLRLQVLGKLCKRIGVRRLLNASFCFGVNITIFLAFSVSWGRFSFSASLTFIVWLEKPPLLLFKRKVKKVNLVK